jgi:hypothetical protein
VELTCLGVRDCDRGMGRKLRVEYPGAIYHVMNRGDRRELIFADDQDRRLFVEMLAPAGGMAAGGPVTGGIPDSP